VTGTTHPNSSSVLSQPTLPATQTTQTATQTQHLAKAAAPLTDMDMAMFDELDLSLDMSPFEVPVQLTAHSHTPSVAGATLSDAYSSGSTDVAARANVDVNSAVSDRQMNGDRSVSAGIVHKNKNVELPQMTTTHSKSSELEKLNLNIVSSAPAKTSSSIVASSLAFNDAAVRSLSHSIPSRAVVPTSTSTISNSPTHPPSPSPPPPLIVSVPVSAPLSMTVNAKTTAQASLNANASQLALPTASASDSAEAQLSTSCSANTQVKHELVKSNGKSHESSISKQIGNTLTKPVAVGKGVDYDDDDFLNHLDDDDLGAGDVDLDMDNNKNNNNAFDNDDDDLDALLGL
jgi:hypothetical protein